MFWGSAGFILGTVFGSFAKALADRSLTNRSFWGRSYCPKCKNNLHWYDLLPLVSYSFLGGKCRYCSKRIGVEYPLVEVVMGILTGFLFWSSGFTFDLIFKTFFITILAVLFITDLKKMIIPDRIVIPAIIISLIYVILQFLFEPVLMAFLIGLFFTALIIITKGKGMGGGDVKLGVFMGLALGFPGSLVALVIAFLSGAIVSLILIISGKKHFGQVIPFGPFLVLGSLVALFWSDNIMRWYLTINF